MSRKYKFHNKDGLYFVSFATVNWIDVFVREEYFSAIVDSLRYCQREKGLKLFCWCIMPSHIHLIFSSEYGDPGGLMRDLKSFTSKTLQRMIVGNIKESRREWILSMLERAGKRNSNIQNRQFWQQHNKPIELWSNEVINQKLDYTHMNPVVAGFVNQPEHWKYSSAIDYAGGKGLIDIEFV